MPHGSEAGLGRRALLTAAAAVVVIAGMRALAAFVLPVCVAVFLALVSLPPVRALQRRNVPDWLSFLVVFSTVVIGFAGFSLVVGAAISDFQRDLQLYQTQLARVFAPLLSVKPIATFLRLEDLQQKVQPEQIMVVLGNGLSAIGAVLSDAFLVLVTLMFILAEAAGFPNKLRLALGDPRADLRRFQLIAEQIQSYFVIKSQLAASAGICAWLIAAISGVDFSLLWGVATFFLLFIPVVGPALAMVPPSLFALLEGGWPLGLVVFALNAVLHFVIGNVLEPKMMGERLGLSAVIAFLSLVFWGWMWGSAGMLLSVPLTMIVKIGLENSDDFKWVAILLGPNPRPLSESRWSMRSGSLWQGRRLHARGIEESRHAMRLPRENPVKDGEATDRPPESILQTDIGIILERRTRVETERHEVSKADSTANTVLNQSEEVLIAPDTRGCER